MIFGRNTQTTGQEGERAAEHYLHQQGLSTLARNYRCPLGELDLVMRDGDTLVFVEVRQRKSRHFGSPLETISRSKQNKVIKAAQHYLNHHKIPGHQALRFDVVGLVPGDPANPIEWVADAFGEPW